MFVDESELLALEVCAMTLNRAIETLSLFPVHEKGTKEYVKECHRVIKDALALTYLIMRLYLYGSTNLPTGEDVVQ